MTEKIQSALKSIELLHDLPDAFLAQLAQFSLIRTVRAGETIFCQGEPSPYCFGVVSGEVTIQRVSKEKGFPSKVLGILGPGHLFGESALFDITARTAMATATQRGELVAIMGNKFRDWISSEKGPSRDLLLGMLRNALSRLRETSNELSILHGLDRLLGSSKPIAERLEESLDFVRASVDELDELILYRRNPYWDEFEPWVAVSHSKETSKTVLGLDDPLVREIHGQTAALKSSTQPGTALVPLLDRDKDDLALIGFLAVKKKQDTPLFLPHLLLLLSSIAAPFSEVLLRQQRQDDLLAQTRLHQGRQSFTL